MPWPRKDGTIPSAQSLFELTPTGVSLLPFGCLVRPTIPPSLRAAHYARTEVGILVGYDPATKGGYRIFRPTTQAFVTRDDLHPEPTVFPGIDGPADDVLDKANGHALADSDSDDDQPPPSSDHHSEHDDAVDHSDDADDAEAQSDHADEDDEDDDDMEDRGGDVVTGQRRAGSAVRSLGWRVQRKHRISPFAGRGAHGAAEHTNNGLSQSITWSSVSRSPEAERWMEAACREMRSHIKNDSMAFVYDAPDSTKIIGSRWVLVEKISTDGSVIAKARLVAQGFSQVPGVHFHETRSRQSTASTHVRWTWARSVPARPSAGARAHAHATAQGFHHCDEAPGHHPT